MTAGVKIGGQRICGLHQTSNTNANAPYDQGHAQRLPISCSKRGRCIGWTMDAATLAAQRQRRNKTSPVGCVRSAPARCCNTHLAAGIKGCPNDAPALSATQHVARVIRHPRSMLCVPSVTQHGVRCVPSTVDHNLKLTGVVSCCWDAGKAST